MGHNAMSVSVELVLVDFDDTLVDTAPRFQNARRRFYALLAEAGLPVDRALRIHDDDVDPHHVARYGLGPHRMEPAFRETYVRLCDEVGAQLDHSLIDAFVGVARDVAGTPPCIDGAVVALRRLAAAHPTILYTQSGVPDYQLECIRGAGVLEVLAEERIRICERKTVDEFRSVIRAHGVADPARAWMIGNSIRSDINPALEAGANAILVEVDDPWAHDIMDPVSETFHRVRRFPHAVDLLVDGPYRGAPVAVPAPTSRFGIQSK
jgi:putative hydrolase of the HAD superfamily